MRSRRFSATVVAISSLVLVAIVAAPVGAVGPLAVDSALTLNAEPASVAVGDTVTLSGTLTFGDASSSAGQTITLSRDDAAGTHPLEPVTTAADGSYTLDDTARVGGDAIYHAAFGGAADVGPSEATATVSVSKLPTNVSIRVNDHAVTFGRSVKIRGHLGKGTRSRMLELYAKPDGHAKVLLRKARVNHDGVLSASFEPTRDTTFIAHFDGDRTHRSSEDSTVTRVRVIVTATLLDFVSTSGKFRIYKAGSGAHCRVHVSPNHRGFDVHVTLQGYTNGGWKTLDTASYRLNARSSVGFVIQGSRDSFRVMAKLPTHADHLGNASAWRYLRFE
jgi:hypothetical protein